MWRTLLLPFSFLFGLVLRVRHFLYDQGILKFYTPPIPSIVVGNLCLGGSGKTPMVLKIGSWLVNHKRLAFLSRGYGRKSKGFHWVELDAQPEITGDEPRLFKAAFPDAAVAVDGNRTFGIQKILQTRPKTQAIVLDDAFQHRKVKAGLNVLLIPEDSFHQDRWLVPAGKERDLWYRRNSASVVVITKCKNNLTVEEKSRIVKQVNVPKSIPVFFSFLKYDGFVSFDGLNKFSMQELRDKQIILVTGIADGSQLKRDLEDLGAEVQHLAFKDHYDYTQDDIGRIEENVSMFAPSDRMILTTGKDRVKLEGKLNPKDVSHWFEIQTDLVFDREEELKNLIFSYVDTNSRDRKLYS
jgi:tetraacyldisaccharide 4'-kinase